MNTNLELYRVFCEVAKYESISKAAEKMYISQSAITQSIKKLENLLGGQVFYRSKTGVELTEEGKNLYEYVKDSIETMSNAEHIFSKYVDMEKSNIKIGGGNSILSSIVVEPLLSFIKDYPDITISLNSGLTDSLMQQLSIGKLDLVALNLPYTNKKYTNIEITPLKKSSYSFFASKKYIKTHPLKDFSNINEHTLILPISPSSKSKILAEYCKNEGIEITANYELSSSSLMKKLVLNNVGIGFANTDKINDILDDIVIIRQIEIDNTSEGIATLKKTMCSKATLELANRIKEYYKE